MGPTIINPQTWLHSSNDVGSITQSQLTRYSCTIAFKLACVEKTKAKKAP